MAIPRGSIDRCSTCGMGPFCGPDNECEHNGSGVPASLATVLEQSGYQRVTRNHHGCTCGGAGNCADCPNKNASGPLHDNPHPGASYKDADDESRVDFERGGKRLPGCMPPSPDPFDSCPPVAPPYGESRGPCRLHPGPAISGRSPVRRQGVPPSGGYPGKVIETPPPEE